MGKRTGIALKALQWFLRGVQFCCAGLVLAIYSYFLAILHIRGVDVPDWIRAVEGISGAAALYTLLGLLLLCCIAGYPLTSFIAIVFDVAFAAAFIYVAQANRGGASDCRGFVNTPVGSGDAETSIVSDGRGGTVDMIRLRTACQMESACLAMSIVAIFFFIFSILVEVALARHRSKEKRFGPGPANNYTSGYGSTSSKKRRGLFGLFGRRKGTALEENELPEHVHPDQLRADQRQSYATEATAVNYDSQQAAGVTAPTYAKYSESGMGYGARGGNGASPATPARYDDGVYDRV